MYLKNIDQSKLKFKLLKKLVQTQINSGVLLFTDLESTVPNAIEIEGYGYVKDQFEFDFDIETVYNKYKTSNPKDTWNSGGLISFGFALDKNNGEIYYPGDFYPGARVGQVLYLHSRILGMKELCMAQELITVDDKNYTIIFSYIKDGMTKGIQEIKFDPINDQKTRVTHVSRFKGVSSFRDKFYPFFHSMIISKFHENMIRSLK